MSRLASTRAARLRQLRRELERGAARLESGCLARVVARHRERYGNAFRLFQTLKETASPDAILAKGYALVRDEAGRPVRSPDTVAPGDALTIRVAGGQIAAEVCGPALSRPGRAARLRRQQAKASQASLF
jgi:exodeoxyribonuclease VII large subunit